MRPLFQPLPSHGIARAARMWLLWLALALGAAHSAAVWHGYTHGITEAADASSSDKQQAGSHCGLCIAAAGLDGAAPSQAALHLHRFAPQAPRPLRSTAQPPAPQRRPYAIRAPPLLSA